MFSNQRKTIGILVEAVLNEFPRRLCQGVIEAAEKSGYNVAIFTSYGSYGNNVEYFKGDCHMYELPPYESLDGMILLLDTIQNLQTRERVLKYTLERCQCPIVSIRENIDGANNLLVDNTTCMESIIRHFIEVHGFTRLCFMTGPKERWDSIERLNCFQRIMKEYNLPVDEHQIFYGDFWRNMGDAACDWFLHGSEPPQAILCANDYMAAAVASELIKLGYDIPKDICVSGYDGLKDTLYFSPSLTTVEVPFYEMGMKAVEIIDNKQETPSLTDNYFFDVTPLTRESCGCQRINDREVIATRRNWFEEMKVERNRKIQFNFLSIHLGECRNINEISDKITEYIFNIQGFQDYCVCLCKDLEKMEQLDHYTEEMELRIAIRDCNSMGPVRTAFSRDELLPAEMTSDKPQAWYFAPLHFENRTFGYEAIQFQTPEVTANIYFDWSTNISNAIQDVLNQHKMKTLIKELEYMYDRDALTGMYNRRGFENHASEQFAYARRQKLPFFLAIIDLDGMKQINDIYGHVEGDFALKKIRHAIQDTCEPVFTGARTGGDEFVIFANNISKEQCLEHMRAFENYLQEFNQLEQKPYHMHASLGYMYKIPDEEDSLESYIKVSDEIMYKNKVENKLRRNEPLR